MNATDIPRVAVRLIKESMLSYDEDLIVKGPEDVTRLLAKELGDRARESFYVLHLNARAQVISLEEVSRGGLTASIVEPRAVFQSALLTNAAAIILAHNHPSGNPEPSAEDIVITSRLVEAGNVLGVPVRDHLIVTDTTFTSFARRGLIT